MAYTTMATLLLVLTVFALPYIGRGHKCSLHKIGERYPDKILKLMYIGKLDCLRIKDDTENLHCVEWDCPEPDCANPIKPEGEEGCPVCNGTCIMGGKAYKSGEGATCPDGCNGCWCNGGGIITTLIRCAPLESTPVDCQYEN